MAGRFEQLRARGLLLHVEIREDDLTGAEITALLRRHLEHMREITPEGSVHAHELERLRAPDITVWSAWIEGELVGCAGLREIDARNGEIKSVRTAEAWRGRGIASTLVVHAIAQAAERGYEQVFIETGATEVFRSARALYARHGFEECGPFGDYRDDPHSHFMARRL